MSTAEGYLYYPPGFESEDHTARRGEVMNTYDYVQELIPEAPAWAQEQLAQEIDHLRAENEKLKEYHQVIDEALIVRHLGVAKGSPREELYLIISYDIDLENYMSGEAKDV